MVSLHVDEVVGSASGFLLLGLNELDLAYKGGSLYVDPILLVPVAVGGAPGVAGAGQLDLSFGTLTDPAFSGVSIHLQGAFFDSAATQGTALTQGLRVDVW